MTKRILLIMMAVMTAFTGCKSHKDTVVNARAELSDEDMWQLTEMRGKEPKYADGQSAITIHFNPDAASFNGFSGCNRYFGQFKDLGDGKMALGEINGTKMACPESYHKLEGSYMQLLRRCDGYNVGQYTLELLQDGKVVLTFEKMK